MAMHVPKPPGFQQMMKEGSRMFQGLEEAVIRNIGACKQLAETVQTAYGPIGMNKMVINHLGKLFVTNDAATIIRELETTETVADLLAAHQEGKANAGICVDDQGGLIDAVEIGVLDLFAAKYWGMKYATAAACTVLRVDQIIMAKRAGGPKPRDAGAQDADDD
ncbi:putative T-complex protein 1 subunit theta [Daphnia magna]|uniref:Putative T-complex protein 1 subunit theta n=1 Tax=Daphnia magna TaxID=35525 RepID=A0A162RAT0_9CRUS|nr:putative T-complex protein 1 subunit theta [Daphnia magna]